MNNILSPKYQSEILSILRDRNGNTIRNAEEDFSKFYFERIM